MAAVQCTRCTAERKGFRRELDSWRHRLIHCVGFESILEGIYGPLLLRDLNLFNDCEPEEVGDWSPEASRSLCSFCNLSLDKLTDQAPAATSPLSSPSDYSPCQTSTISESSQSAHKFLQAVFHNKDVTLDCDSNIPLVAQELMKKMIHQFAVEYASKCLLRSGTNGVTRSSSPLLESSDGPLDLTVSRTIEEKESKPEPDGVLDLSNRNSSSSSTLSASIQKATGSRLPLVTEERGGVEQRGTNRSALDAVLRSLCPAHRSLLYQILKLAHQENLLLFLNHKPVVPTESHCCHCSASPQDNVTPHSVLCVKCKAHICSLFCNSNDHNHQSHCSLRYHPGDSKSTCSIHQRPFKDCNVDGQQGPSCGCVQRCRMGNHSALCSKKLHCNPCKNLAAVSSFTAVPLLSQTSVCTSSRLCSSVCYKQHNSCSCCSHHACLPQVKNAGDFRDGDCFDAVNREQSPSPPRLSPIPSDIIKKNNEKPPSLFHHRQEEEADPINKNRPVTANHVTAGVDAARENELPCKTAGSSQTEQTPNGTSLQDVMNRFSQKLENITPLEKDSALVSTAIYVSEKEQSQFPSTSQNLPFHTDSHLTEIITTVLHTGNASDYNLNELFTHHDNREPKSPNTRARRRQEIQIAIATPADNATSRRYSLEIKRKLAVLDSSCNRKKVPQAKKARLNDGKVSITLPSTSSDPNLTEKLCKNKAEVDLEPIEDHRIIEGTINALSAEHEREEVKKKKRTVLTEELIIVKGDKKEREISLRPSKFANVQHLSQQQNTNRKRGPKGDPVQTEITAISASKSPCKKVCKSSSASSHGSHEEDTDNTLEETSLSHVREGQKCQSNQSGAKRRSMRNIVPPQRFNSYVTWQAPIFHVSIKDADVDDTQPKSKNDVPQPPCESARKLAFQTIQTEPSFTESKDLRHVLVQTMGKKEENPEKHSPEKETNGGDCGAHRRLRSSTKKLQVSKVSQSPLNDDTNILPTCAASSSSPQVEYISPIKLMFVSQVKDKGGVKYSLKSARSGTGTQVEEPFDPCEESSWSGTGQKCKSKSKEHSASSVKPVLVSFKSVRSHTPPASLSENSASSPAKSASSPPNSASSPAKSASSPPKSASSPPKSASSPAKSASSPLKSASSPAKSASSPPKSASSPPKSASFPAKSASSPLKSASSPAKSASSPPKSASSTAKTASSPAKSASSPLKSASSPPKSASSPPKSASSPPKSASSPLKSASSPAKSASSPAKSASSPAKSASSPPKSASSTAKSASSPANSTPSPPKSSPRLVSSSPKNSSRRPSNSTPTKYLSEPQSHRLPGDLSCETTPPKRRPGRPKKMGPQPEKRVKRPIGRPPKQKTEGTVVESKSLIEKGNSAPDEDNVAKNLKITVLYGRSRRNKRMVSEGCDPLQTDFTDACKAVEVKRNLATLLHCSKSSSGKIKTALEELHFVGSAKELASQSSSNIKCQKKTESLPLRKPGRPAKVRISGISVTVTTVSPRQRKIQINKEAPCSPEMQPPKKALLPEFKSAKAPSTVSCLLTSESNQTEEETGTKTDNKRELPSQPVAVRHSMRVRKPSVHLLHAVATSSSRSYSCSSALLRRSKKLLLNKASNERKQEQQNGVSGEKRPIHRPEREGITQNLSQVARVSLDSVFRPKEMVRWWTPSAKEKTMNQELARRIRVISDTWVSNTADNQDRGTALSCKLDTQENSSLTRMEKKSSAVRTLFDCSPNKPRSCSMQQICSWFMQTTETQSLAIVKKASSRNPYELMHFPRYANKESVCYSPQAERLRKHIKKFAKTVPKSPLQHQQAQQRLRKKKTTCKRQLFISRFSVGKRNCGIMWWKWTLSGRFWATLMRARTRFLTRKQRERWQNKQRNKKIKKVKASCSNGPVVTGLKPNRKALHRSAKAQFSNCVRNSSPTPSGDQTREHVDEQKEQKELCSKAWSPETLKECRVFLRKINSPGNESTEEWDSCTVTLDDGSPSTYLFAGEEQEMEGIVKAVKNKRKRSMNKRTVSREPTGPGPKSAQNQDVVPVRRQMGKRKHPEVVPPELPQPPPAKMLRQSRMRGLSGPRWCDFVFEN